MKILVVDDEETMVRSLSTLLAEEGYEVAVATDGPQALEAARAERPDLILLDVMLPGVDGIEVCRQIRTWSTVPIIMLTAKTGDVVRDVGTRRVAVRDRAVTLSPKEFDLLKVLLSHPGRVLGRDFLLNQVWGEDFFGDTRTLDVHIRWLREKIEQDPSKPEYIQTVHGVGYRFSGSP